MKRVTLYSSSRPSITGRPTSTNPPNQLQSRAQPRETPSSPVATGVPRSRWRSFYARHEQHLLWLAAGGLITILLVFTYVSMTPRREITQEDIQAAVLHTLETNTLPSPAAKAYELVRQSIVRVNGWGVDDEADEDNDKSVGTGVVIVDKGIILTNLHVVLGAKRVQVVFADGLKSDATIVGTQPEHDLAVLQAETIPDDLVAATMRSTADLALGDQVVAVGFPFGIGPSVTAGVVSGLRREFRSPEGKRVLTNLIQFDAAVNPGSSGGPLVTPGGEVVGIVTAILNPTAQRFFVGIGFAVPIENAAAAAGLPPF
jgi:S1-C subfamily serine protease